jgi:hypothetical protein
MRKTYSDSPFVPQGPPMRLSGVMNYVLWREV